jgi:transcriptional regulator with XRE-family HTH domain
MAGFARNETEIADRISRYLKAELKRENVTYEELADRLGKHGLKDETMHSVAAKLKRGTFPATFLIASLAALEREGLRLEDV